MYSIRRFVTLSVLSLGVVVLLVACDTLLEYLPLPTTTDSVVPGTTTISLWGVAVGLPDGSFEGAVDFDTAVVPDWLSEGADALAVPVHLKVAR